jgi:hypothetical protein
MNLPRDLHALTMHAFVVRMHTAYIRPQRRRCMHTEYRIVCTVRDAMRVVFIHCPYSNPHPPQMGPPQMGRVWVENNDPLKKWGG